MEQPFCNSIWRLLRKINIFLSYNPTIALSGTYPIELKSFVISVVLFYFFSTRTGPHNY
jgi:hypothetical protein